MKEFVTAVQEVAEDITSDDHWPLTFKLDGRVMHFRRPNPGEGTILVTQLATHKGGLERFATYLDFFTRVLRPDDKDWWTRRVLNEEDPLSQQAPYILAGDGDEGGVLHEIVEQWGAHPTESSSRSSASQPPPGSSSTPSTPASTYSESPSPSSSTSSTSGPGSDGPSPRPDDGPPV